MKTTNTKEKTKEEIVERMVQLIKKSSKETKIPQSKIFNWNNNRGCMISKMARAKIINILVNEKYPQWMVASAWSMPYSVFLEYLKFSMQWEPEDTQSE